MRITRIAARTIPVPAGIRNALVNFSEMTGTLVRVEAVPRGGGPPVIGLGFGSIGRYAATAIVTERLAPRLLQADPDE